MTAICATTVSVHVNLAEQCACLYLAPRFGSGKAIYLSCWGENPQALQSLIRGANCSCRAWKRWVVGSPCGKTNAQNTFGSWSICFFVTSTGGAHGLSFCFHCITCLYFDIISNLCPGLIGWWVCLNLLTVHHEPLLTWMMFAVTAHGTHISPTFVDIRGWSRKSEAETTSCCLACLKA